MPVVCPLGVGRYYAATSDVKIIDLFEGTQQIQQLIIARGLLGKSSAELK